MNPNFKLCLNSQGLLEPSLSTNLVSDNHIT